MAQMSEEWMTVAEAADRLGLARSTLSRAARVGTLETRRSGRIWLTTAPAVRAWLKEARHRPGRKPRRRQTDPTPE
jgi:excisionase family DNA binding protein